MITKNLILTLFKAASILRWNDKLRSVELTELDKQAHKMIIAYLLGKLEENIDWIKLIEGGIFELLQRIVVTDIKPQIYYKIKSDKEKYKKLNDWAFNQLKPSVQPLGTDFCSRYLDHFNVENDTIEKRILSAAHFYATSWEFKIIERANPAGYEISDIRESIQSDLEKYYTLKSFKELVLLRDLNKFIDLCGELRFQVRWSTVPRIPKTYVLGHMYIVAILCYLFSLEINACNSRKKNNYYTGLFHDLPEVLTRDIISPVKESIPGLSGLIKNYEKKEMLQQIYTRLKPEWHDEIRLYTENEFKNTIKGKIEKISSDEISIKYNKDHFSARDGELVKICDDLTAFVECYLSLEHGINSPELKKAKHQLANKYAGKKLAGIDFGEIFNEFNL